MAQTVQFGIDQFLQHYTAYKNKRIALLCNAASVTAEGLHSRLALQNAGFNLIKLFSPEHGFDTTGADGAFIHHNMDKETRLPIISLYGDKLAPSAEDLADVDVVLIDLPDIGARFYTYLWTMTHVLESCCEHQTPVMVLDRPNPFSHGLHLAEGPFLDASCSSFIGRWNIPITHQCTFAELALYFKNIHYPTIDMTCVTMDIWYRNINTGYNFHPTSPAIQRRETIYTYPGACLFEGLNIDEGRDTMHPFAQFGAPWIDVHVLYEAAKHELPEAQISIVTYTPNHGQYTQQECYGLKITPIQIENFQPIDYFLRLIQLIIRFWPNAVKERNYLTNANPSGSQHLDKLLGIPHAFDYIREHNVDTKKDIDTWIESMRPYLLY